MGLFRDFGEWGKAMQNVPIIRPGSLGDGEDEEGALMYGVAELKSPLQIHAYMKSNPAETNWSPVMCFILYYCIIFIFYISIV